MRSLIIAALLLLAFPCLAADRVLANKIATLRLSDSPCTVQAALESMDPQYKDMFHSGAIVIGSQIVRLCWVDKHPDGTDIPGVVFVIDQSGSFGVLDLSGFTEAGS